MSDPIKVYLASRFGRQEEIRQHRERLRSLGFVVVSRWLDEEWSSARGQPVTHQHKTMWAAYDYDDVRSCDVMINFTEPEDNSYGRGGRHVEFGLAMAWNKRLVVVGHRENVFHHLPFVEFCETFEQAVALLESQKKTREQYGK